MLRSMRIASFALAVPFVASTVWAQDDFGGDVGPEGDAPQVAETHVVKSGDTLWDLCSKYLNSPWYWPKIWSYNPQITNPHWIYPGNELRFYPGDESLPTNVEVARGISIDGEDDVPEALDADDLVRTTGSIQVGRTAPDSVWSSFVSFVSSKEHAKAGEVVNSESESIMLSDFDKMYVKLKTPAKKGDRYAVYRPVRNIEHPVTGDPMGMAVEIIGGVQIIDTSPKVATAMIAQAYRPIERGDFVGEWPEGIGNRIAPAPNSAETEGYIVETVGDVLGPVGEYTYVFIDRGRSHGVQKGNTFVVLDRGDGFTREVEDLPNEEIGQLMVIDVQDNASTAIITHSVREFGVGDKIAMRPGS